MSEQELANRVVEDMDIHDVCEYAANQLAEFYRKNPIDFKQELVDYEE